MFRRFSINFAILSMVVDSLLVLLGLITANILRPYLSRLPRVAQIVKPLDLPWYLYLVFLLVWAGVLLAFSIYDGRRNLRAADEFTSLTIGSFLAAIIMAGVLFFSYRDISRVLFIAFWLITFTLLVIWRLGARLIFHLQNGGNPSIRRVLIVGAGPLGQDLQGCIEDAQGLGLDFVGFLDDDPDKRRQHDEILGPLDQARRVVTDHRVQDVILALPTRAYQRVDQLVAELHDLPVKVYLIPDYFHLALHKAVMTEFAGIPMMDLRAPALSDYQRMIKRVFDLAFCVLTLPFVLPVMGVVALATWIDDRGPAFFRQLRVGENGVHFEMLKFRTMVPNAEGLRQKVEKIDEYGNLIHKTKDDPRVTRVGHFLRRTSLDELPQLFNVLKGEMSIIGPRPEMPYLVDQYEPWQRTRFAVPQGITGWWQVNGRSDKPMHLNTEDDLYYVQNYSLWLDIQILIKTIFVVLRGKGAY
jgi:exopolysaccharide biosynthesis polyprenyl glycosylphosphotransferase